MYSFYDEMCRDLSNQNYNSDMLNNSKLIVKFCLTNLWSEKKFSKKVNKNVCTLIALFVAQIN